MAGSGDGGRRPARFRLGLLHAVLGRYQQPHPCQLYYVFGLGGEYCMLQESEEAYAYSIAENRHLLAQQLISQRDRQQQIVFDPQCFADKVVNTALERSKPEQQKLLFRIQDSRTLSLCFVDELGGVVYWSVPATSSDAYLQQMQHFILHTNTQCHITSSAVSLEQLVDDKVTEYSVESGVLPSCALTVAIHPSASGRQLTLTAKGERAEFEERDAKLAFKVSSWLERCWGHGVEEAYLQAVEFPAIDNEHLTCSQVVLEKVRIEKQLGLI